METSISIVDDSPIIFDRASGITIKLKLMPLSELRPHEETIDSLVEEIARDILSKGFVRDPLIVDENTQIVLDGMHRLAALNRIDAYLAPCALIDYSSESIRIGRWIRVIRSYNPVKRENLIKYIKKLGGAGGRHKITILVEGIVHYLRYGDPHEACEVVRRIETYARSLGIEVFYESGNNISNIVGEEQISVIIIPPKLSKTDVIASVSKGKVFPPKSTRHIIPARPINLRVPLKILFTENLKEANKILVELVFKKKVVKISGGFLDEYRRYDEAIYYFHEDEAI